MKKSVIAFVFLAVSTVVYGQKNDTSIEKDFSFYYNNTVVQKVDTVVDKKEEQKDFSFYYSSVDFNKIYAVEEMATKTIEKK